MAQMHIPILVDWDDIKDHMAKSDIVEVVRCKDCKHLFEDNKCPLRTWWTHTEDDFCSYAERRADE